jgi:EmrB/QacA subfamily drug resistance transporter
LLKGSDEPNEPAASGPAESAPARAPAAGAPQAAAAGHPKPAFFTVFPSIMLPMFLAVVDQTIVATALPAIAAATEAVGRASWVIVAYLIAATIAAPIYGRLGDAFGRRRMMFVALGISIAASLMCAAAPNIEVLTIARIVQGLGGGGLMTLSQALIGEAIPPRERARFQGYLAAIAVCANTFGPVVGGIMTEHFGWRSIFLVNVPIALAALVLIWRLDSHTSERTEWRADPAGFVLFTVFVVTTLLALDRAQHVDLGALPIAGGLFLAGVAALALLIRVESHTPSPLIPISLLRRPEIWHSDALAACHGGALVALITFLPIYLQVVRGLSPSAAGLLLVPLTIGIGTGSLLTGRLVSKTGRTTVYPVLGLIVVTANMIALAVWASVMGTTTLALLLLWNGLFTGTVMGVVQVLVQTASGPLRLGEAAASVQFSRSIGAGFGTAIVATVLFAVLSARNPDAARAFASMIEHGRGLGATLNADQRAAITGDITVAFRAAFLTIAAFTTAGFFLALTNPLRKI